MRKQAAPKTRQGRSVAPRQTSGLIAREKDTPQSAALGSALDNRSHRTTLRLSCPAAGRQHRQANVASSSPSGQTSVPLNVRAGQLQAEPVRKPCSEHRQVVDYQYCHSCQSGVFTQAQRRLDGNGRIRAATRAIPSATEPRHSLA